MIIVWKEIKIKSSLEPTRLHWITLKSTGVKWNLSCDNMELGDSKASAEYHLKTGEV